MTKSDTDLRKLKYRFKISNTVLSALSLFIPVIIVATIFIYILSTYVKDGIDKRNLNTLSSTVKTVDSTINELERLNIVLGQNPAIKLKLKSVINKIKDYNGVSADDYEMVNTIIDLLYGSVSFNQNVASLYVYTNNDDGWFISDSNRFSNLDFFFDTDWYDAYRENLHNPESYWMEFRTIRNYLFQEGLDIPVLTIYHKLYSSGKSEPDGLLVLNVRHEQINSILTSLLGSQSEMLYVLDKDGNIIFRTSDTDPAELSRIEYAIYSSPSTLYNWQFIHYMPKKEVYSVPILLTRVIIIISCLAGLIGFLIAWFISTRNYHQILELVNTVEATKMSNRTSTRPKEIKTLFDYVFNSIVNGFLQIEQLEMELLHKEYQAKNLELGILRSRLNPHFLFNTMQNIEWKAIALTNGPNPASLMIEELSDILNYALDEKNSFATLEEEIAITKTFSSIQKKRHGDQFTIRWDIQDVDLSMQIPKLILQPILENSLKHGLKDNRPIAIRIVFTMINDKLLRIRVIDTGIGLSREKLHLTRKDIYRNSIMSGRHIGLSNTFRRIKLIYGDKGNLFICSRENKGTIVTIKIPIIDR